MNKAVIALVGIIGFYYLKIYQAARLIEFSAGSIRGIKLDGLSLKWEQQILMFNPSNVSIPVNSISLQNYLGTAYAGTSRAFSPFTVKPGYGSMWVNVDIPIYSIPGLGMETLELIRNGVLDFRLKGHINSVGFNIPIDESFKNKLPFKIKL